MKKLKRFVLSFSCSLLRNEEMIKVIGGAEGDKSCDFHASSASCSGSCSYADYTGTCTYGSVGTLTGCYCNIP